MVNNKFRTRGSTKIAPLLGTYKQRTSPKPLSRLRGAFDRPDWGDPSKGVWTKGEYGKAQSVLTNSVSSELTEQWTNIAHEQKKITRHMVAIFVWNMFQRE
ncbi:MAG: hypothetical protein VW907_03085 [Opitutae bacterium]